MFKMAEGDNLLCVLRLPNFIYYCRQRSWIESGTGSVLYDLSEPFYFNE
jgi:hypothetical protein